MPTLYDNFSQVRQYIDQEIPDLTSYVTKTELANASYVTSNTLNSYLSTDNFTKPAGFDTVKLWDTGLSVSTVNGKIYPDWLSYSAVNGSTYNYSFIGGGTLKNFINGRLADIESTYATTSYVADYVATYGGGVIDESIIPKDNLTYQLGDATHNYKATYTSSLKSNDGGITVQINNNNKYYISSSAIRPTTTNSVNLGTSDYYWGATYTDAVYVNTNNKIYNTSNSGLVVQRGGTDICGFLGGANIGIAPLQSNSKLGNSSMFWQSTYSTNLYSPSLVLSYSYNSIDNASNTQINFKVNQWNRMKLTNTALTPSTNNGIKLGDSGAQWSSTYVRDLYLNGTNIDDKFPTYAYVADYVAEHGGGSTVIDENIIPKENNTYSLGSSSYKYNKVWATNLYGQLSGNISNASQLAIDLGGSTIYRLYAYKIVPNTTNSVSLGDSGAQWSSTYVRDLYLNGTNIEDRFTYLVWTGTSAEYLALSDYTTYQFYLVQES